MEKDIELRKLGLRIARLRHEKDLSQEELAFRARKATNSISNIECGKANVSYTTLVELAAGLNIELHKLISDAHYSPIIRSKYLEEIVNILNSKSDKDIKFFLEEIQRFYEFRNNK